MCDAYERRSMALGSAAVSPLGTATASYLLYNMLQPRSPAAPRYTSEPSSNQGAIGCAQVEN